jgi:CubicO group peptidase (beta-lactamase class C family)
MPDWNELDARIREGMSAARVPGLSIAVLHGGELAYAGGFGVTSDTPDAPAVTADTVFRIGSVTKPLTATLIMRLVEAGTLDLDTPVTDYVPWLKLADADATRQITLRMLLSHIAGLPTALDYAGWREPSGLEAYVRTVLPTLPLVAPPGAVYAYSNPGYNLAGYVAEAATGTPYTTLMQRKVFGPLGMAHTTFDPLLAMTWPFSQSFILDDDGKPQVKRPFVDNHGEYPCGFAMSTVRDLARFMQMQVSNCGSFLSADSVADMQRPHAHLYTLDARTYGLGLRQRRYKDVTLVGHNGAISKFGAVMWWEAQAKTGVVMLINRNANFWGAADRIALWLFDTLLNLPQTVAPHTRPTIQPINAAYAGSYIGPGVGLVTVMMQNGEPSLLLNGVAVALELMTPQVYRGMRADGGTVAVGFCGTADAPVLYIDGSACTRCDAPEVTTEASIWADRLGTYAGDTDIWRLRLDGDELRIYSVDDEIEHPALLLDERRFVCDFGLFEYLDGERPALLGGGGLWRFTRQEQTA